MTNSLRIALTLGVFALTLALVSLRPRGWNEAWWSILGGLLMLALGMESPHQAWDTTLGDTNVCSVLLFLLALLLFSALLEHSGFFEWAAIRAALLAHGDAQRLYRNAFVLGALITAVLSLDTTAVILTPLVLAFVQRLGLPARPYIFACAFVANTASLPLPVSNLTNLLFAGAFHLPFGGFALRMVGPQVIAVLVNYGLFRWLFRRELTKSFDQAALPDAGSVIPHQSYFRGAVCVLLLVLCGYFAAPLLHAELFVVGFLGCGLLALWGAVTRQIQWRVLREISWSLFPFVIGLFVVVRGVENLGLTGLAGAWTARAGHNSLTEAFAAAGGTALAANVINNIPSALLAVNVLRTAHAPLIAIYAALLGTNIGPNLTLFGSLATMLVLTTARKRGEDITGSEFLKIGLLVTPLVLLVSTLVLWLSFLIVPG